MLLVIDARGMTRGIAPLILGYQAFDRDIRIGGVILNRVGGSRHEAKLRAVIEHYTDVPVLGAVAEDAAAGDGRAPPRPDALRRGRRRAGPRAGHRRASSARRSTWTACATSRRRPRRCLGRAGRPPPAAPRGADLRIGIARDRAFGFYYPDDLAALEAAGAELVPIDTLHDARLPALDGLFIGGGFPETCMAELEANAALRGALREAIEAGLPTYAECGGLMYLSRSITWQGRTRAHGRRDPRRRGDARRGRSAAATCSCRRPPPCPGRATARQRHACAATSSTIRASRTSTPASRFAYRVQRGHGIDGRHDGVLVHKLLASYAHLRTDAGSQLGAALRRLRAQRARTAPAARRACRAGPAA